MRIIGRDKTADRCRMGKRARGFTLVEVMVAVMLLMFAMAGLVPFFIASLNQSSAVRYKSTATNIAREKMEEIRQLDYREITGVPFLADRFGVAEVVRGVTYTITYGVVESPYDTGLLKEVTVTVGWTAPPRVSAASLTTMIHQQYLGPRISRMEVHTPDPITDPLGTPFDCLLQNQPHTLYCYIAEADWGLVIDNLNEPGMAVKNVYMRLTLVDEKGTSLQIGSAANDYKVGTLTYTLDSETGLVDEVYIPYTFDSTDLPDGYWEFRAVAFNQYDEPGNLWRLRLRVENSGPSAPTMFIAVPQYGNEAIQLYWSGGAELDRDHYVIRRRSKEGEDEKSWSVIAGDVDPASITYLDQGNAATGVDPYWQVVDTPVKFYEYEIYAVDIAGKTGAVKNVILTVQPMAAVTTTTTLVGETTTTNPTVTTVASLYTISIVNTLNQNYSILIEPGDPTQSDIYTTAEKRSTKTVSGLPAGNYDITATSPGKTTVYASFTLGPSYDPDVPVLTIL